VGILTEKYGREADTTLEECERVFGDCDPELLDLVKSRF
jgi:hypothetical protein